MYIKSIRISNLRVLNNAEVDFCYPGRPRQQDLFLPNANLFLGPNGSGKSTLLKAVVLAALGPHLAVSGSGFKPDYLVRRNHFKAEVSAEIVLDEFDGNGVAASHHQTRVQIVKRGDLDDVQMVSPRGDSRVWKGLYSDFAPSFFVAGYGAGRAEAPASAVAALERQRSPRYRRVASIFEPSPGLMPLKGWLPSMTHSRIKEVASVLDSLLAPAVRFSAVARNGEYLFDWGRFQIPSRALSDGYRNIVSLASDLLFHLAAICPESKKLTDLPGIVLIDEVDLLLHPEWQSRIVSALCSAFPKLQFILTSHSELVVGSLQQQNIFVIRPAGPDRSRIDPAPDLPSYGLDAVQLLVRYFGHPGRDPQAAKTLRLLEDKALAGDRDASLRLMEILSGRVEAPIPGSAQFQKLHASSSVKTPAKVRVVRKVAMKKAASKKAPAKKAVRKA